MIFNIPKKKKTRDTLPVPKSVNDTIPVKSAGESGIFFLGKNRYSCMYEFSDINYDTQSKEEKEKIFSSWMETLNSFDPNADTKITVCTVKIPPEVFERDYLMKLHGDGLDGLRTEYNSVISGSAGNERKVRKMYLTVTAEKNGPAEASAYFERTLTEFRNIFRKYDSDFKMLTLEERLRFLYDFYHRGRENGFLYTGSNPVRTVSPESMEIKADHMVIDGRFYRVMYLKDFASYIRDDFLKDLSDTDESVTVSIDAAPIPTEKAVKQGERRLMNVETNISNWMRKQVQKGTGTGVLPYDMEKQREESREFLDDLVSRDQKMIPALITLVFSAETKEELEDRTERISKCASKHLCRTATLRYQQLEGLTAVLPYGPVPIETRRTLTTESLGIFMPFRVRDVCHENGIYLGTSRISGNIISVDRSRLQNGNSFILGVSGSGKSMIAKEQLSQLYLTDGNCDIIIIDPEREYTELVGELGGENIEISSVSPNHINVLDMNRDYAGGTNPVTLKSEFIMSLFEELKGKLTPGEKSVIDRCTSAVYSEYLRNGCTGTPPTLADFRKILDMQPEPEARDLSLASELFTDGNLDVFSYDTNVNTKSRLISFDIKDLGKQLMPVGMLAVLDSILNRITDNRISGRKTYIFIDEIYLLFRHEFSAEFLFTMWKRVRKYGAFITGVTQNVEDLLQSHTARSMLSNSEYVIMMNQSGTDLEKISELMKISETGKTYISDAETGTGLAKIGNSLVPFANRIPAGTKLYALMNTDTGSNGRK